MDMKVTIIGAGSMGCIIASKLAAGGAEVTLVDTYEAHVKAINENGLTIVSGSDESDVENVKLQAVGDFADVERGQDVVLFLVKGVTTSESAQKVAALIDPDAYVMSLQNGIGNVDLLLEHFPREKVLYGLMQFAGQLLEPGRVKANLSEKSCIYLGSALKEELPVMNEFGEALTSGGLKANIVPDVDGYVWAKLRSNINNVIFGLLRLSIGNMATQEGRIALLKMATDEVDAVAAAKGITYPPEKTSGGAVRTPSAAMMSHLPSTAQDMKNKRPTEIEFLNGAVYREGQKLGVPTPVNELLYRMVTIYQDTYDMQY
jgi:2-dehydropantoate 2-reductase